MTKPFRTDGCSGGMSWLWKKITGEGPPWEGFCVAHDLAYWAGGKEWDRLQADCILRDEIERTGHPLIAWGMFWAVRLGGPPLLPLSWRWGYRFDKPTSYARQPATWYSDSSEPNPFERTDMYDD